MEVTTRADLLRSAYALSLDGATDDASLVERMGHTVGTFQGSPENIKVTTQVDLLLAEAILFARAGAASGASQAAARGGR